MPNVTAVKPSPKNENWRIVTVEAKDFIVFSAAAADALEVGKPLPEGTEEAPPKFDGALPSLKIPYKKGTAPAAFRNTKEGFLLEQTSIHRSVALKLAAKQLEPGAKDAVEDLFNFYLSLLSGSPSSDAGPSTGSGTEGRQEAAPEAHPADPKSPTSSGAGGEEPSPPGTHGEDVPPPASGKKWKDDAWAGLDAK